MITVQKPEQRTRSSQNRIMYLYQKLSSKQIQEVYFRLKMKNNRWGVFISQICW